MPNKVLMEERFQSHLARVSDKAIRKELDRINALRRDGKISGVTATHMTSTSAIRLAWLANAS